jgi:hypothetical protein
MSDCLFCGIVNGSIKADVVYRDETVIAFKDIVPRAPVHVLIIPTAHIAMLSDRCCSFPRSREASRAARSRKKRLSYRGQLRRRCRSDRFSPALPPARWPSDGLAARLVRVADFNKEISWS